MAELNNEFSWSHSREKVFEECRRKYFIRYYEMWEGWKDSASERQKKAYRLTKVTNIPMFVGSQVHAAIGEMLSRVRMGLTIKPMDAKIRTHMMRCFTASERGIGPSRVFPLFYEDEYGSGISEQERQKAVDEVVGCIQTFYDSKLFNEIRRRKDEITWNRIDGEGFDAINLGGFPVHCYPDLAIDIGEQCHVYDWKTGNRQEYRDQVLSQALWAVKKLNCQPEYLTASVYTVNGKVAVTNYSFTSDELAECEVAIIDSCIRMYELHEPGLKGDVDAFEKNGLPNKCGSCQFFDICEN